VLVPLLGTIGPPADRWWALKRGQCWFPCWVTIGPAAEQVLGPLEGPVLVPLRGTIGPPFNPVLASVGSPAGYYLTSC
jgi:hypothetical protein